MRHIVASRPTCSATVTGSAVPGGEPERHVAAAPRDREYERLDVAGLVRREHVVDLQEVDAPRGELRDPRVDPRLGRGVVEVEAEVVRVPPAGVGGHGDVGRRRVGAGDRQGALRGEPRDAPHDVDAEPQAERVHLRGERGEPGAVRGGREPEGAGSCRPRSSSTIGAFALYPCAFAVGSYQAMSTTAVSQPERSRCAARNRALARNSSSVTVVP